jgi:hypothetical protein
MRILRGTRRNSACPQNWMRSRGPACALRTPDGPAPYGGSPYRVLRSCGTGGSGSRGGGCALLPFSGTAAPRAVKIPFISQHPNGSRTLPDACPGLFGTGGPRSEFMAPGTGCPRPRFGIRLKMPTGLATSAGSYYKKLAVAAVLQPGGRSIGSPPAPPAGGAPRTCAWPFPAAPRPALRGSPAYAPGTLPPDPRQRLNGTRADAPPALARVGVSPRAVSRRAAASDFRRNFPGCRRAFRRGGGPADFPHGIYPRIRGQRRARSGPEPGRRVNAVPPFPGSRA